MDADHRTLVLLTGASGYIGGRLLKALEKAGWPVRCLAAVLISLDQELLPRRTGFKPIVWIEISLFRQWLECTRRITCSTRWGLQVSSKKKTGKPRKTSPSLHASLEFNASSIWADWETRTKRCPLICAVVMRLLKFCAAPESPPLNFAPPS